MTDVDLQTKIEELYESSDSFNWNSYERQFIEDMAARIEQSELNLSDRQQGKIWELWEKLHGYYF